FLAIVLEVRQFLHDDGERVLRQIFSVLNRRVVATQPAPNQRLVNVEELGPTHLVGTLLQSLDQAERGGIHRRCPKDTTTIQTATSCPLSESVNFGKKLEIPAKS